MKIIVDLYPTVPKPRWLRVGSHVTCNGEAQTVFVVVALEGCRAALHTRTDRFHGWESWTKLHRASTPKDWPTRTELDNKVVRAVLDALDDRLRRPPYRGAANPVTGHCYVASEALYHLLGGRQAGWTPMFVMHEGAPHWFLKNVDGRILDATAGQFRTPVPYGHARGKGFLTRQPSKRARVVMDRIVS